jgi:hypothetical protein
MRFRPRSLVWRNPGTVLIQANTFHTLRRVFWATGETRMLALAGLQPVLPVLRRLKLGDEWNHSQRAHAGDASIWSISCRSLRMVYSACKICARNSCSGGIDGRPVRAYSESSFSATSEAVPFPLAVQWKGRDSACVRVMTCS